MGDIAGELSGLERSVRQAEDPKAFSGETQTTLLNQRCAPPLP